MSGCAGVGAVLALGWVGGIPGGDATDWELDEAAGGSKGLELVDGIELFSGGGPAGGSNGFDIVLYAQEVTKIKIKEDGRRRPASPATCLGCLGTASLCFDIMIICKFRE